MKQVGNLFGQGNRTQTAIGALITILLGILSTGCPVSFPDQALDGAVRDALGKPSGSIYTFDVAKLTKLEASDSSHTSAPNRSSGWP